MAAIELEGLTKRYGGKRGVEDLTLEVGEGEIFGFIGPNGAGKTTTLRTMLGLLRPTSGTARLLGRNVVEEGPRSRVGIGYAGGETHLYDDLAVGALLAWVGRFHGGDCSPRRAELADTLGLDLGARTTDLSLGNRKKVALVAALQHRPRLVLLDEPTNGLDPVVQAHLFEVLREEARGGTTVFFSSHVLSEVQRVCARVAVLTEGRLTALESVAALRGKQVRRVKTRLPSAAPDSLATLPGVTALVREGNALSFLYAGAMTPLLQALAAHSPEEVQIEEPSLEEIFLGHYAVSKSEAAHVR
ncbi:MAG: ABC transporter ATP-binding protein [Myxococcota bacterium]|nr:ABC transporter ATP-binding protein [Myxococcota bacterium]